MVIVGIARRPVDPRSGSERRVVGRGDRCRAPLVVRLDTGRRALFVVRLDTGRRALIVVHLDTGRRALIVSPPPAALSSSSAPSSASRSSASVSSSRSALAERMNQPTASSRRPALSNRLA